MCAFAYGYNMMDVEGAKGVYIEKEKVGHKIKTKSP